jgi:hypothetical protein
MEPEGREVEAEERDSSGKREGSEEKLKGTKGRDRQ